MALSAVPTLFLKLLGFSSSISISEMEADFLVAANHTSSASVFFHISEQWREKSMEDLECHFNLISFGSPP